MALGSRDPAFLGTGWHFPPSFADGGATIATVTGADDVRESLEILVATEPGERVMREAFGCGLRRFLFEEIDGTLFGRIRTALTDAVLDYEPRITLGAIDIAEDPARPGLLRISISYTVRATNTRYNLVFPFYTREAASALP